MTDQDRKTWNEEKLNELLPQVAGKVRSVLNDLEGKGYHPKINEAYRSPEDQLKKYKQGLSKIKSGGKHQKRRAVDIIDARWAWSSKCPKEFWLYLASSSMARGMKPGLFFGLSVVKKFQLKRAICVHNFEKAKTLSWGWDEAHIES